MNRLQQCVVEIELGGAMGSGFAWDRDLVVTNAHVVNAGQVGVRRTDGQVLPGRVVISDPGRDLAVLAVPGLELPAVLRREAATLRPGEVLFAIGHPLGVRHALSSGVLHAVGLLPDGFPVPPAVRRRVWVQADLHLAPGNSGGPLADSEGRVVGINTMIVAGLALAVPITEVEVLLRRRAA
jgi:serine protease Do